MQICRQYTVGYHCCRMASPNKIVEIFSNPTVTAFIGFVGGFIVKTVGERLFADSYTTRQLRTSIYRELAFNYDNIQSRIDDVELYPSRMDTLSVELRMDAYNNGKQNVVLFSNLRDAHYIDFSYKALKSIIDWGDKSPPQKLRLLKQAAARIEDTVVGDTKLLRKFVRPKYRYKIAGL